MTTAKRLSIMALVLVIILFIPLFNPILSAHAWDGDGEGRIEVLREPRFSITTIGSVGKMIFANLDITLYIVLKSGTASVSDYYDAMFQHFGINLTSDGFSSYSGVFTLILEFNGIGGLLKYLEQYFWWVMPSWLAEAVEATYLSPDGALRLLVPIGLGPSLDISKLVETAFDIVSSAMDLVKALTGKVPFLQKYMEEPSLEEDIVGDVLGLIEDFTVLAEDFFNIGVYTFQGSLKTVEAFTTRQLFNVISILTGLRELIESMQWLREIRDWLVYLWLGIVALRLGFDTLVINVADILHILGSTMGQIIYRLLEMFWIDESWVKELIMGALRVFVSWLDPPDAAIYASILNATSNEVLLGYDAKNNEMVQESSIGFMIGDDSSQGFVLRRLESINLTINSIGEVPTSLPYTVVMVDGQTNETFGSSGWLTTGESASLLVNTTDNETHVSNYLIARASVSTQSPAQGQAVAVNVTVTDSIGDPRIDANVSLLVSNSQWVIASNSGSGLYQAIIDTSNLLGLVPVGIYASYQGMISGYDAILLEVIDKTPPVANTGQDITVNEDTPVTFNGSISSDNVGIVSYKWTFTDVTPQTLEGMNPTYIFSTPGTYAVTLNVTDAAGNWSIDTMIVTVLDVTKPIADAGQNQTVNVGSQINLDASGSTDNVGIVRYEWDCGDGTTHTGRTASHVYTSPGKYTVTLTVRDAAGNTATDTIVITVLSTEPIPMWILGIAIATLAIAVSAVALWRRKVHSRPEVLSQNK